MLRLEGAWYSVLSAGRASRSRPGSATRDRLPAQSGEGQPSLPAVRWASYRQYATTSAGSPFEEPLEVTSTWFGPVGGAEIRPATPPTSHVYPNSALRDESSTNRLEIPATAGKSSEVSGRSRALRDAAILDPMFLPVGQTFRPNLLLTRLPNPLAYSLAFCMKVPRDWMGEVMVYWLANSPNKGC